MFMLIQTAQTYIKFTVTKTGYKIIINIFAYMIPLNKLIRISDSNLFQNWI